MTPLEVAREELCHTGANCEQKTIKIVCYSGAMLRKILFVCLKEMYLNRNVKGKVSTSFLFAIVKISIGTEIYGTKK